PRVTPRIPLPADVLLRELVDLLVGALVGELGATADCDPLVRIVWVDDEQRDPRIAFDVTRLCTPARRVEPDCAVSDVDPDDGRMGRAVRPQRRGGSDIG